MSASAGQRAAGAVIAVVAALVAWSLRPAPLEARGLVGAESPEARQGPPAAEGPAPPR